MKKIPFNLERALAGDKVVTSDGREVTQLTKFDFDSNAPLYGVLDKNLSSWTIRGKYWTDCDSPHDLFMAPKTVKRWVNFYPKDCCCVHNDEEAAKKGACENALAIAVPVEFEEGYGCEKAD